MTVNLDQLNVTFHVERDYESPDHMQRLSGHVVDTAETEVASLDGFIISRQNISGQFHIIGDAESSELFEFCRSLFDKNGLLRRHIVHGPRSGTGCWGAELNEGMIVYVAEISVQEQYRHQGFGSLLLKRLAESEHVTTPHDNIFCWPMSRSVPNLLESFVRKNGFRRVGVTAFFCFSTDPAHASHEIAANGDMTCSKVLLPAEFKASGATHQQLFPFHHAIADDLSPAIRNTVLETYQADAQSIYARDFDGVRPIYIAVQANNKVAFDALVELGAGVHLGERGNADGTTALECFKDRMQFDRDFVDMFQPGTWDGYSKSNIEMEYGVKNAMGIPTGSESFNEYFNKYRYGCSCGQCIEGWLSPRMAFQLQFQADCGMDEMTDFWMFSKGEACGFGLGSHDDFLPPSFRPKVTMAVYRSFSEVFRAISDILMSKQSLSVATIMLRAVERHPKTLPFFRAGGRVEYVLDALTRGAIDQSYLGDSEFLRVYGEEPEYVALPVCENDLEFDLVRKKVGLNPEAQWYPYRDSAQRGGDEDEDDEDDSDSDDEVDDDEEEY